MGNDGKCTHKGCNCPVTDDGAYCSSFCKDAAEQDLVEIACECGHASCG